MLNAAYNNPVGIKSLPDCFLWAVSLQQSAVSSQQSAVSNQQSAISR